jgi:hypothetical protein
VLRDLDVDVAAEAAEDLLPAELEDHGGLEVAGSVARLHGAAEGNLLDRALEHAVLVAVDADLGGLSLGDARDVRLADLGRELHAAQVRDREDLGAGHVHGADHHQLPDLGVELGDHAVDRRDHHGAPERLALLLDLRLGGGERLLELDDRVLLRLELRLEVEGAGSRVLERLAADVAGQEQALLALRRDAGELEVVLRADDAGALRLEPVALAVAPGLGALERGLQVAVVEAHDEVARAHPLARALRELHDAGRDLRGDVDLLDGLHDAGRGDQLHERRTDDRIHPDRDAVVGRPGHRVEVTSEEQPGQAHDGQHGRGNGPGPLHSKGQ